MDRFVCLDCGKTFDNPKMVQESRGEFWGAPAYEEMAYCPYCMGDFVENKEPKEWWVAAYTQLGDLFGDTIEARDTDDLFNQFHEKYPDAEIADYGCE